MGSPRIGTWARALCVKHNIKRESRELVRKGDLPALGQKGNKTAGRSQYVGLIHMGPKQAHLVPYILGGKEPVPATRQPTWPIPQAEGVRERRADISIEEANAQTPGMRPEQFWDAPY